MRKAAFMMIVLGISTVLACDSGGGDEPDGDGDADADVDSDGDNDALVDPCEGLACSGHGFCLSEDGTARCECDDGYHAEGLACVADADAADGDADTDVDGDSEEDECTPSCIGRECGPDGCEGSCGEGCDADEVCSVDGECISTCIAAGGNTCTDRSTTFCDGLPEIPSHDCELCCDRSVYPEPSARSFHIVHIEDVFAWDSVFEIATEHDGPVIASQNKSPLVEYDRWAKNISVTWYASGEEMADTIHETLMPVGSAPIAVMIDELRSGSIELVEACANRMRTAYPQWEGRWGAYLVHGEAVAYPALNPAIDALLDANAILVAEMYPAMSRYCAEGSGAGARDVWLGEYFRGSGGAFPQGRFHWLSQRRSARGSSSHLSVLFGVHDRYMDMPGPAVFLDRMFYVWVTRSGYPSVLDVSVGGGPGAWKWDLPYMSNTSRDLAFRESFDHYSVRGERISRLGQVACE